MAEKIQLMKILYKNTESGKYEAVLSDDSVDRDNEIVAEKALSKACMSEEYLPILLDHDNKAMNQIGEWTNKRMEMRKGHSTFVAEPKFWKGHPEADVIKNCLDQGAKYGISIGASVNDYDETKIEGKSFKRYTDIEIYEASFVGVPSNRNGVAQAVTKAYNKAIKNLAGEKMTEEMVKKADFDAEVEKSVKLEKSLEDIKAENKELIETAKSKDAEVEKLNADLAKACEDKKAEDDKKDDKDQD